MREAVRCPFSIQSRLFTALPPLNRGFVTSRQRNGRNNAGPDPSLDPKNRRYILRSGQVLHKTRLFAFHNRAALSILTSPAILKESRNGRQVRLAGAARIHPAHDQWVCGVETMCRRRVRHNTHTAKAQGSIQTPQHCQPVSHTCNPPSGARLTVIAECRTALDALCRISAAVPGFSRFLVNLRVDSAAISSSVRSRQFSQKKNAFSFSFHFLFSSASKRWSCTRPGAAARLRLCRLSPAVASLSHRQSPSSLSLPLTADCVPSAQCAQRKRN